MSTKQPTLAARIGAAFVTASEMPRDQLPGYIEHIAGTRAVMASQADSIVAFAESQAAKGAAFGLTSNRVVNARATAAGIKAEIAALSALEDDIRGIMATPAPDTTTETPTEGATN